jgi:glycosyltransferase involved in cell wall biosynthesis
MKQLKILIVCEHASNQFGGEAMLPYKYFHYLKKLNHEVYLLTHARTRSNFEGMDNVYFMPDTKAHILLNKWSKYLPDRISLLTTGVLSHYITQIYQWIYARKIIKAKKINVIHEPAPVSPKQPSIMFGLGVPVIIGPMNGGIDFPHSFKFMAGKLESFIQVFARLVSHLFNIVIPGKLFAARLLVANQRTKEALPYFRLGKVVEIVENAADEISPDSLSLGVKAKDPQKTNVLYVGRLVDWKAVDVLIDVFAKIDNHSIHLDIVGEGHDMASLKNQAKDLGNVTFHGWVEHSKIHQIYDQADIFVLPSVRECGGAVVLEAMARGVPTIATAWGGPIDYISEGTGYLIEPKSREFMIDEFRKHIEMLSNDPESRKMMGVRAKAHIAEHFLWETKVKKVIQIYLEIVNEKKVSDVN